MLFLQFSALILFTQVAADKYHVAGTPADDVDVSITPCPTKMDDALPETTHYPVHDMNSAETTAILGETVDVTTPCPTPTVFEMPDMMDAAPKIHDMNSAETMAILSENNQTPCPTEYKMQSAAEEETTEEPVEEDETEEPETIVLDDVDDDAYMALNLSATSDAQHRTIGIFFVMVAMLQLIAVL